MTIPKFLTYFLVCTLMTSVLFAATAKAESLTIKSLEISALPAETKSIGIDIKWTTNLPAYAAIVYGTDSKKLGQKVTVSGVQQTTFNSQLTGLKGDTTYYFQIEVSRGSEKAVSFVRSFKTSKTVNYVIPEITNVTVAEYTGKTAVIRWLTSNIDSKGTLRYGTTQEKLSSRASTPKGKLHEVVLKNLKPGTRYYYQVSAEAADKRIHKYVVESFRTVDTDLPDRENLNINQIRPLTIDENLVGSTDMTIKVQTNRSSAVSITLTPVEKNRGKAQTKKTTGFRDTNNQLYFDKLQPNTTYRAGISVRDVLGRNLKVSNVTFATRAAGTSKPVDVTVNGGIDYSQKRVVKSENNPTVYILIKDAKFNITRRLAVMNEKAFIDYGLRWNQIETISRAELQSYPLIRLVRTNDNPTVYMVEPERRLKLSIPNELVFNAYSFDWTEVARVNDSDLSGYYQTALVKEPGSATVYMVQGQTKKAFTTEASFARAGFNFEQVFTIHPQHLQWFTATTDVI